MASLHFVVRHIAFIAHIFEMSLARKTASVPIGFVVDTGWVDSTFICGGCASKWRVVPGSFYTPVLFYDGLLG